MKTKKNERTPSNMIDVLAYFLAHPKKKVVFEVNLDMEGGGSRFEVTSTDELKEIQKRFDGNGFWYSVDENQLSDLVR